MTQEIKFSDSIVLLPQNKFAWLRILMWIQTSLGLLAQTGMEIRVKETLAWGKESVENSIQSGGREIWSEFQLGTGIFPICDLEGGGLLYSICN